MNSGPRCAGYGWLEVGFITFLLLVGILRIVSTYGVFSQTWDEPAHVACGMEWLQEGTYDFEDLHPPLARVAVALLPYLAGLRLDNRNPGTREMWAQGNDIFEAHGDYMHNLALARIGVLPFFVVAVLTVWYWTRTVFGPETALAAVGLLTFLPPILAHAGLATTDFAVAAMLAAALFTFCRWVGRPTRPRALALGLAAGLAILCKFTALLFLPACALAVLLVYWITVGRRGYEARRDVALRLRSLALAGFVCALTIWAGYRFSFRPMTASQDRPHQTLDRIFGTQGKWHRLAYRVAEKTPIPASEFFLGLNEAWHQVASGRPMYLLGKVRTHGWWYFFLVALLVKTPIAFLLLSVIGVVAAFGRWREGRDWSVLAPPGAALALLLVCLPTGFDLGLRHILPIYPLLAIVAGLGVVELWHLLGPRWLGPSLAVGLCVWMAAASVLAHPDYLAYFNRLAGDHPERILVNSDLDWGQDLLRLTHALRARHIQAVAIAYNGTADLKRIGMPQFSLLLPCTRATGWIAISLLKLELSQPSVGCGGYSWLMAYKPMALVGKSIRLYYIPGPPTGSVHALTTTK